MGIIWVALALFLPSVGLLLYRFKKGRFDTGGTFWDLSFTIGVWSTVATTILLTLAIVDGSFALQTRNDLEDQNFKVISTKGFSGRVEIKLNYKHYVCDTEDHEGVRVIKSIKKCTNLTNLTDGFLQPNFKGE